MSKEFLLGAIHCLWVWHAYASGSVQSARYIGNELPFTMILNTGASSVKNFGSIISTQFIHYAQPLTFISSHTLGELIPVVASTQLSVRYESTVANLSVQVVAGDGPDLVGSDWLCSVVRRCINWSMTYWGVRQYGLFQYPGVFEGHNVHLTMSITRSNSNSNPDLFLFYRKESTWRLQSLGIITVWMGSTNSTCP